MTDIDQPIGRTSLAVEVTERLRSMILEGEMQPGEKIREKHLTERFGVSRTPLREALKVLAAEGLLELVPNRGAIISQQTGNELREIFPVLAALEGLAGEEAATRADDATLRHISRLTEELRATHDCHDRPAYFTINQAIHAAILEASGNATLIRAHSLLACRVQRARYQANLTRERWSRAVAEHEHIADALLARDAALSGRLMRAHLLAKLRAIAPATGAEADIPAP